MIKQYCIIKNGVVDNVIIWDKEAHPSVSFDGDVVESPTIATTKQDLSGNDTDIEWRPTIGSQYVDGEFTVDVTD